MIEALSGVWRRLGAGRLPPALAIVLIHLLARPVFAAETGIRIGDTTITVPTPSGFTPVTKDMARLDQTLESFVAPSNVRLASFIPEEFLPAVQRGELPAMPRTLSLQTNKKTVAPIVTASEFTELKRVVRKQNEDMVKKAQDQMPGLIDQANEKLGNRTQAKVNGMAVLPPHEDTERSLAYSMRLDVATKGTDGQVVGHPGVVTVTFLHARGKLFFTYVNGGENDLEWSRQISKEWAAAILAANPSDDITAAKESARSGAFGWDRVARNAAIGAILGGAIGLLRLLFKRKPSR